MTSAEAQSPERLPAESALAFEEAVKRLAEIVKLLEDGSLPLEESLRLFEEGVRLARTSQARLDAAEKRVEELLSIDNQGNPVVRELGVPEVKA
jgi:exodeoxyribonuclease VII small subunit